MRTYLGAVALVILAVLAVAWQQSLLPWPLRVAAAPPKISAPVPLPADVPRDAAALWLGESGDDAYGYPQRQVDQGALQALVRAGLFERAEAFFVELQQRYEQDYRREHWPLGALGAFDTADPALTPALEGWIKRYPKSYAAYAARGAHRLATAWAQRGEKYLRETELAEFVGFQQTSRLAAEDFEHALVLKPRFHAGYVYMLRIAGSAPSAAPPRAKVLARALTVCPLCESARRTYLWHERPVWGGSVERAEALTTAWVLDAAKNPRLALFAGDPAEIRCDTLYRAKKYDDALVECERAVQGGPDVPRFLVKRAHVQRMRGHNELALADFDAVHRLDPQNRAALEYRPALLMETKRYREAVDDLVRARHIDPVDTDLATKRKDALQRLVYAGWEAQQQGKATDALALFDMALEVDPQNKDARARRIAATGAATAPSQATDLEQRIAQNPDDFGLHRQLDDAYLRQGRLDDIVALWTKFLAAHPDHGLAHWERAGTYHHKHDQAHALTDARDACRLGVQQACAVAGRAH